MRKNSLFWGAGFVIMGAIFLLDNLGIIRFNVWGVVGPVFLILLGIWIVVSVTRGGKAIEVEAATVSFDGTQNVSLTIHHGAGRLGINADQDAFNQLKGTFGGGLVVNKVTDGNRLKADLSSRLGNQRPWTFPWSLTGPNGLDWDVLLSRDAIYTLRLETGADDAKVDLSALKVVDFQLGTGASTTAVTLPEAAGYTRVRLEGGATTIKVKVPGGVAAQIRSQSGMSSINIDQTRFPRTVDGYRSPEYDTAVNKVDIDIQVGAGSIRVY